MRSTCSTAQSMELPVTVLYCMSTAFKPGDVRISDNQLAAGDDKQWQQFLNYWTLRYVVENVAASHYALGFYISYVTSSAFRRETSRLFRCRFSSWRRAKETSSRQPQRDRGRTQSLPLNAAVTPDNRISHAVQAAITTYQLASS